MSSFFKNIWNNLKSLFKLNNLGLLIIISGNLVPLALLVTGFYIDKEVWSPDNMAISNRVFIWIIAIPFFILVFTFLGQLVFYRMDLNREMKELKEVYDGKVNELNANNERHLEELKNFSNIFSIINNISNKDVYSSIIFTFLIEKIKQDILAIKEKDFIAEGWYWKISNKFILNEAEAYCTCILKPEQVNEQDIHEYFQEQYNAISSNKIKIKRVLIVNKLSELNNYTEFVLEQLTYNVDFYILSKDFDQLVDLPEATWNNDFKRDFALADDKYLLEAIILNNDLRGYQIKEIRGNILPPFVHNIRKYSKPVFDYISYFSNKQYNPINDFFILKNNQVNKTK